MEKHINYQLIEKISRNRRKNRDNIKRLTREKEFYSIQLSIPLIDKLNEMDYKILDNYKFFIKEGEFKSNPITSLRLKKIRLVNNESTDKNEWKFSTFIQLTAVVRCLSYDRDSPTIIYIDKEGIKLPIVYISVEEKSRKYRVDYSEFNSIKNYPDFDTYKNQRDLELSKIIAPYYFTGYSFKVEYISYDKELKKELDRKEIKLSLTERLTNESAKIILPDKYFSWKFNKD